MKKVAYSIMIAIVIYMGINFYSYEILGANIEDIANNAVGGMQNAIGNGINGNFVAGRYQ